MISTKQVRKIFLDFFAGKGHTVRPSSALVPHNDPTLMFTNAGMVQFKNIFTGVENAPNPPRAATSQKCVRAGGKHNDLDNVGYTARHHTFFEMLGNFSFGDYFKEDAIKYAWELLTSEQYFGIPAEKLLVTVYHTDMQAFDLWKKIAGLPDEKIIRITTNDNFWSMGDTGPCGPCSEIFYDHGAEIPGGPPGSPDEDGDRFIEIWNLVFMQFEQVDANTRIPLPKPSIDTGMGLERLTAVLQHVHDNYDIDLFKNLISASMELTKTPMSASHKVIADHLRSSCFLIADGVMPSNEGRGYVLRRIMRRAMRHAHLLGAKEPLMYRLVPAILSEMGEAYPELQRAQALITETLRLEEERFRETLGRGLKLLDEAKADLPKGGKLSGDVAFKLYDTYGFPLDLTQDILRGTGQSVDMDGFTASMEEQKTRARAAWKGSGEKSVGDVWFDVRERTCATEFLGYTNEQTSSVVLAILKDGAEIKQANVGDKVQVVLNQTTAYGESGGQVGDTGWVNGKAQAILTDTTKPLNDLHVHHLTIEAGALNVGDTVEIKIDANRRAAIRANHSATHLLHASLRKNLGEHITQKGSQVTPDRLRFDFSHNKALSTEEIAQIEAEINAEIWKNIAVSTKLMNPEDAIKAGAMALFGEKYGDEVRVLSMGDFSTELCGGTHVGNTGEIGLIKIISEGAIASGIRRIEAVTREGAVSWLNSREKLVRSLAAEFKVNPEELPERVSALLQERKELQTSLAESRRKAALGAGGAEASAEKIGDIDFIGQYFPDMPPAELRGLAQQFLQKAGDNGVAAVVSGFEGKGSIVVAVGASLLGRISAVELVQAAVIELGGKGGGGRPELAQGGGADGDKGEVALGRVKEMLK